MTDLTTTPIKARVRAVGTALPERVLTNAELERMVETNDEWIVSRTGIRERRGLPSRVPRFQIWLLRPASNALIRLASARMTSTASLSPPSPAIM